MLVCFVFFFTFLCFLIFFFAKGTILLLAHIVVFICCWMMVFFVPMAKTMRVGIMDVLFSSQPLKIRISNGYPNPSEDVILCVFQAANRFYYKYSAFGINIVLFNILFIFHLFILLRQSYFSLIFLYICFLLLLFL